MGSRIPGGKIATRADITAQWWSPADLGQDVHDEAYFMSDGVVCSLEAQ